MTMNPQGIEIATASRRSRTWFWAIALVWLTFLFILATVVLPEMKQLGHVPTDRNWLWLYRTVLLFFLGLPLVLMVYNTVLATGALKQRGPPGASEAALLVVSVIPSARWPRTLDVTKWPAQAATRW